MTTDKKLWTINEIQAAARKAGSHWFDPDTMRFFGTKVLPDVYQGPGGVFFVTNDKAGFRDEDGREFTVREFDPTTASVGTCERAGKHRTKARAIQAAKREAIKGPLTSHWVPPEEGGIPYSGRGLKVTAEEHQPVTVLEQFVSELRAHGHPEAQAGPARELIRLAGVHHRLAELACSEEWFCKQMDAEGNHPRITSNEAAITALALSLGASGVRFSGDPRGATVRLTFKDGATNDYAREGWVVPTSEKE